MVWQFLKQQFLNQKQIFEESNFQQLAVFWNVNFNNITDFNKAHFCGTAAFKDVNFMARVDFSGVQFLQHANFDGSTFEAPLNLNNTIFFQVPDFRKTILKAHFTFHGVNVEFKNKGYLKLHLFEFAETNDHADKFRRMKELAIISKDHEREQDFFAKELRAKRFYEDQRSSSCLELCISNFLVILAGVQ